MKCTCTYTCDRIREKEPVHAGAEFLFSTTHSFQALTGTRLETKCTDSSIIALHSQNNLCPAHFQYVLGGREYHIIGHFMPHFKAPPFR